MIVEGAPFKTWTPKLVNSNNCLKNQFILIEIPQRGHILKRLTWKGSTSRDMLKQQSIITKINSDMRAHKHQI